MSMISNGLGAAAQVAGTLDPLSKVVDSIGGAIGLPKEAIAIAKVAIGIATQDYMMAASGGLSLASKLTANPPAQTEYRSAVPESESSAGYAKSAAELATAGATQAAAEKAVAEKAAPKLPAKTASQKPSVNQKPGRDCDDPRPAPRPGRNHGHTPSPQPPPPPVDPKAAERAQLEAQLSAKENELQYLRELQNNFGLIDDKAGLGFFGPDGLMGSADFQKVIDDPHAPASLKEACRWALGHMDRLDTAAKIGNRDGLVGHADMDISLANAEREVAELKLKLAGLSKPGTTPAPTPTTPKAPTPETDRASSAEKITDIINDPSISLEDKIQMILMAIYQDNDKEILDTMKDIASAQQASIDAQKKARAASSEGGEAAGQAEADATAASNKLQMLTQKLQRLMERQGQMFNLMSNISKKFDEMVNHAIQNMGR